MTKIPIFEEIKHDIQALETKPNNNLVYAILAKYHNYEKNVELLDEIFMQTGRCKYICVKALLEEVDRENNMLILKKNPDRKTLYVALLEEIHETLCAILSLCDIEM